LTRYGVYVILNTPLTPSQTKFGQMVNDSRSFLETQMKLEFVHTGDAHPFVMAMMQGRSFTLKGEKKELAIRPDLKKGGFSIKSANTNSEMVMTIPVTIVEFDGEAMMTFQYNIKEEVVADDLRHIPEVAGTPAIVGFLCEEVTYNPEATGVRFLSHNADSSPVMVDGVAVGARKFPEVAGRPAVLARPAVKVAKFARSVHEYRGMKIKFE
jgi:hypothetical protein